MSMIEHRNEPCNPLYLWEHNELPEIEASIENVGWTLGNDCPYKCNHCYSLSARHKGNNIEKWMVDRIINQLVQLGVKTVNLGGNEPIFTNGLDVKKSLLPYIVEKLTENNIKAGLTTSGISILLLQQYFPQIISYLNDVDVSIDSPFEIEHNHNRGANIFGIALKALNICNERKIDTTIITTAMTWNFSKRHLDELIVLASKNDSLLRVNTLKPVLKKHIKIMPDIRSYYEGFSYLLSTCDSIDLGEPLLAEICSNNSYYGCPCGRKSFRIHSITPEGTIPISPCVYLHDFKALDLLKYDIFDIINSPQFKIFSRRIANPEYIQGCYQCEHIQICRGGCAARAYLYNYHKNKSQSLFIKDPYCLLEYNNRYPGQSLDFPQVHKLNYEKILVHHNYLCTWIGKPRRGGQK